MADVKGTVVIDPGHGGSSRVGGSSANNATSPSGVLEKTMTLEMAGLVRSALKKAAPKVKVVLTRSTDVNIGLMKRAAYAKDKKADVFLSIHFNAFNGRARGVETLIRSKAHGNVNHEQDKAFAGRVQNGVYRAVEAHDSRTRDRKVKHMKLGVLSDRYLGNTKTKHGCRACLLEIEFIDVPAVDKLLNTGPNTRKVRKAIAAAIKDAILEELRV